MKLVWSKSAVQDLLELASCIGQDSQSAAEFVEARIHDAARLIARYPHAGRRGRVPGTRERLAVDTPYFLAYRVFRGRIRILVSTIVPAAGRVASNDAGVGAKFPATPALRPAVTYFYGTLRLRIGAGV